MDDIGMTIIILAYILTYIQSSSLVSKFGDRFDNTYHLISTMLMILGCILTMRGLK